MLVASQQVTGFETRLRPFCVEFACSPCACVGFLQLAPTVQRQACQVNRSVEIDHRCEWMTADPWDPKNRKKAGIDIQCPICCSNIKSRDTMTSQKRFKMSSFFFFFAAVGVKHPGHLHSSLTLLIFQFFLVSGSKTHIFTGVCWNDWVGFVSLPAFCSIRHCWMSVQFIQE